MVFQSFIIALTLLGQILTCNSHPVDSFESDPEEFGDYFEGDMDLDDIQRIALENQDHRNGVVNESYKWPNNTVYYEISDVFDDEHRNYILKGISHIEAASCLRFYPKDESTPDYIFIIGENTGCHTKVGYRGGEQTLNLQIYQLEAGCFRIGTIMHEILHALGFHHQHNTPDRDVYITIVPENIRTGKERNFKKNLATDVTDYGVQYDYASVMHYRPTAYSRNHNPTIIPKDPDATIGQRLELSEGDIWKLNRKYNCTDEILD